MTGQPALEGGEPKIADANDAAAIRARIGRIKGILAERGAAVEDDG